MITIVFDNFHEDDVRTFNDIDQLGQVLDLTDLSMITIVFDDEVRVFDDLDHLSRVLDLTGFYEEHLAFIRRSRREGRPIYATIDPFCEDIQEKRYLLLENSPSALDDLVQERIWEI